MDELDLYGAAAVQLPRRTQCFLVIDDDWSVPKPELYEAMAVLGVMSAKLTVGLEPMFHLINGLSNPVTTM